jgi:type I restriction enzyme R subunit
MLRAYQETAAQGVETGWQRHRNILMVLPTGAGKTKVSAHIIKKRAVETAVIAHRQELVRQLSLALCQEQIPHSLICSDDVLNQIVRAQRMLTGKIWYDPNAPTFCASVDTLIRRRGDPRFNRVRLWFEDEAHHTLVDNKWGKAVDLFPNAYGLGVTATPIRADGKGLGRHADGVFDHMVEGPTGQQLIDMGYLSPYEIAVCKPEDLDFSHVEHGADGDFKQNQLRAATKASRRLVGDIVGQYLKRAAGRLGITFCVDIEHAEAMRRELANANADLVSANSKYVMQITGDNKEGKDHLDAFISPSELYPVIATTSKLMTTGVDAQTCKLIVLDSNIGSMTEFKQIIGRGTRINEDFGKHYFTIMDFRSVTALFADKEFDGDPVRVKEAKQEDDISETDRETDDTPVTDDVTGEEINFPEPEKPDVSIIREDPAEYKVTRKVTVNGVEVSIIKERVQYMGEDGKIITESLRDYTRKSVRTAYASLDEFLGSWKQADKKRAIIEELEQHGIIFAALSEEIGSAFDPFDLICHVAYEQKPLTRKERADQVKKRDYFNRYGDLARKVIEALLDKYSNDGVLDLENPEIIRLDPLRKLGSPVEIIRAFGGKPAYDAAIHTLTEELYRSA